MQCWETYRMHNKPRIKCVWQGGALKATQRVKTEGKEDWGSEWVEYACHHGQISRLMSSVVPSLYLPLDDSTHWWTPERETSGVVRLYSRLRSGQSKASVGKRLGKIKKGTVLLPAGQGLAIFFLHKCWPLSESQQSITYWKFERGRHSLKNQRI